MVAAKIRNFSLGTSMSYIVFVANIIICFLYSPLTFTSSIYSTEYSYFLILLPLNTALFIFNFKRILKEVYSVVHILLILVAISSLTLLIFSSTYSFCNQHFSTLSIIFLFCAMFFFASDTKHLKNFVLVLFFLYFFEMSIGVCQIIKALHFNANISLAVFGTFTNSGVFGCYLSIMLPIALYVVFYVEIWIGKSIPQCVLRIVASLIFVITFLVLLLIKSRTGLLSFFMIGGIGYFNLYFKRMQTAIVSRKTLHALFLILLVITGISISYLLYAKWNSVLGRFQMSYITMLHLRENFVWGTGLGIFTNYYPDWQSNFFHTNSYSKDFIKNAGEVAVIFNEYLQLLVEVGIVGFLIFFLPIIVTLLKEEEGCDHFIKSLKLTIYGILACGFTSYPLHVSAIVFLLGFCIAVIAKIGYSNQPAKARLAKSLLPRITLAILFCTCLCASFLGVRRLVATIEWESVKENYSLSREDSKIVFRKLLQDLEYDGKYAAQFGQYLMLEDTDCREAVTVLEKSRNRFVSRETYESLIAVNEKTGNSAKAIKYAKWLVGYLPHLFVPKYKLLQLNIRTGCADSAKTIAQNILDTPEKVKSKEVTKIKEFAKNYLLAYGN